MLVAGSRYFFSALLAVLLIPIQAQSIERHDEGAETSGLRRLDADLLSKSLFSVLNRDSVERPQPKGRSFKLTGTPTPEESKKIEEAVAGGIPRATAEIAVRLGNGLTPKDLHEEVKKLKAATGNTNIDSAARSLASKLQVPASQLRRLFKKDDGSFDFDSLAKDLELDKTELVTQRTGLKNALLQEVPPAPLGDVPVDTGTGTGTGTGVGGVAPGQQVAGVDPNSLNQQGVINGDDFLDVDLDELEDERAKLEDEVERLKNQQNNNARDGKNGKNGGAGKAAETPPPQQPPPSVPPLSGATGGGGDKGQPPQMPPPIQPGEPPAPMVIPAAPQEEGLNPALIAALLGKNQTGEVQPDLYAASAEIMKTMMAGSQATMNTILQLGSQIVTASMAGRSQLAVTAPVRANVTSQGSMGARLKSFSGSPNLSQRAAPGATPAPRTPTSGTVQVRANTAPAAKGYGVRSIVR